MNENTKFFIMVLFCLVLAIISANAGYNEGFYKGLKTMCAKGELKVLHPAEKIVCVVPDNESQAPLEVEFYDNFKV